MDPPHSRTRVRETTRWRMRVVRTPPARAADGMGGLLGGGHARTDGMGDRRFKELDNGPQHRRHEGREEF
jgi:hypothetical protein